MVRTRINPAVSMRRFLRVLPLFAVFVGCAASHPQPTPHRFGDVSSNGTPPIWITIPTITGNTATITLFDTTNGGKQIKQYPRLQRLLVAGSCTDQAITINYQFQVPGSSTWLLGAGSAASVSYPSGTTATETDFLAQGSEARIQAVTGGTGPTACNIGLALFETRELGQ